MPPTSRTSCPGSTSEPTPTWAGSSTTPPRWRALLTARAGGVLRFPPLVDQMISQNLGWVPYTQLANLTGRPAMSVPLHWTPEGLPIGVQILAPTLGEPDMFRTAAALERAPKKEISA